MLSKAELIQNFTELGLQAGDTVLVHSAYKSLGGVEGGPQTVIDALLDLLTSAGTLIMPTFNFDFNEGAPWDVRSTPSKMGILTELVRQDPRAKRVFHPFYSFAVIGKHADFLTRERYKSSYERSSVFGKLRDLDGKIMIIGLDYNHSLTFMHHVEQMEGVDYRFIKGFTGEVTDETGRTYSDTFYMLVRDRDRGVITQVNPMGAVLEQRGVVKVSQVGEAEVKLMKANEAYRVTAEEMKRDPFLMYQIQPKP
jgi:aminoglycoside 3-N-acetyltransferase